MSGYFGSEEHIASLSPDELRDLVRYLVRTREELYTVVKINGREKCELQRKIDNQRKQLRQMQEALERYDHGMLKARQQAEVKRLREEVHYLKKGDVLHVLTDQELAEQQRREREMQASIKALDDCCERLKRLAKRLYAYAMDEYPDGTELNFADEMRELGVSTDG